MCYVIIEGLYVGVKGEVEYMWQCIVGEIYVILWQEVDCVIVVYIDDFVVGMLCLFFIVVLFDFYCFDGSLCVV